MILSDREIMVAIHRGDIGFTPYPPADSPRWTATTIDLTLDAEIRPWEKRKRGEEDPIIDPGSEDFDANALIYERTKPVDCSHGFVVQPMMLVLGWTVEKLRLSPTAKIAARVEGKSSLARIGLGIHVTAPIIHPGFGHSPAQPAGSSIRLEIWNISPLQIRLIKGMPICQLIFEEVHGTPEREYKGQFQIQGPDVGSPGRPTKSRRASRK